MFHFNNKAMPLTCVHFFFVLNNSVRSAAAVNLEVAQDKVFCLYLCPFTIYYTNRQRLRFCFKWTAADASNAPPRPLEENMLL
ncbi:hypothetical protein IHE45_16G013100 [Dioscorea alata]|uniref:Uncharacterized protein n=1 Tax=Dioscorea alata TaxID=55571 RepID=A0ACB7UFV5_DIOAL|nr:hypothetical protein IHE45_16G013100 [Dioscorea alata]